MTQKEKLFERFKMRKEFDGGGAMKTHEVIEWGVDNYCNCADRHARSLAKEGKIRRMSDEEKFTKYGKIREDVWVVKES